MPYRPRLLLISFSDISIDPRVMKQVRLFVADYDVTTCGFGPQPHPDVTHIALDPAEMPVRGRLGNLIDAFFREREVFSWTFRRIPLVIQAKRLLRPLAFDAVLANDVDAAGVAVEVFGGRRVHVDLHEFWPGLWVSDDKLGRRQRRFWEWLTRRRCARAASSTTVASSIAQRYIDYGLEPGVVMNAARMRRAEPHPTGSVIRLVHSGNAFADRGLAEVMKAVASAKNNVTLDLYLVRQNPEDYEALIAVARELGDRISVHDPVPQDSLVETLSAFDAGIHVLPPISVNNELALPNKFFDYVQARLAIVVGPSAEMGRLVAERGLGAVTEGFSVEAIAATLESLSPAAVDRAKAATLAVAEEFSAERQVEVWAEFIRTIVGTNASVKRG